MHAQVVTAIEVERRAVAPVKFNEIFTADHVSGIIRHRNYEVEDYVACENVEKVVAVDETFEALFDDAKERVQGTKVFNVSYQWHCSPILFQSDAGLKVPVTIGDGIGRRRQVRLIP